MDPWLRTKTEGVDFGDARLRRHLTLILRRLSARPEQSVPLACPGAVEMPGAYRFFQQQAVTATRVLAGH